MRSFSRIAVALAATGVAAFPAQGQGLLDPATYGFQVQSGLRYWYSNGSHQLNLKDVSGAIPVSRLTWDELTGQSVETFFRADHVSGIFIKSNMGGGSLTGGNLKDEDFPPVVTPYSSTNSAQRGGNLDYWNADVGYTVWKNNSVRLGGFVGYGQWSEQMRAFGCAQTAGSAICVPTIPGGVLGITEAYKWSYGRIGAVADVKLTDRLSLTAEGAYLFGADLDGGDNHHLRPGTLPYRTPIDGTSRGVQLEAVLNYALTDTFSVGLGARYWHIDSGKGRAHFEAQPGGGLAQATTVDSERYGVFVQGSYKLGAAPRAGGSIKDRPVAAAPYRWAGLYAGVNAGTGWDSNETRYSGTGDFATSIASGLTPRTQSSSLKGVVGGVHGGYNWLMGTIVAGVEAEVAAANLEGAGSWTGVAAVVNTTVERKVSSLGSLRARLGFLVDNKSLLYATGGLGFADTKLTNSVFGCAPACVTGTSSGIATGFVIGGGYETAISSNMTWKTEYLYYDLGERTATATFPGTVPASLSNARSDFNVQTVRTGISVKF